MTTCDSKLESPRDREKEALAALARALRSLADFVDSVEARIAREDQ